VWMQGYSGNVSNVQVINIFVCFSLNTYLPGICKIYFKYIRLCIILIVD